MILAVGFKEEATFPLSIKDFFKFVYVKFPQK